MRFVTFAWIREKKFVKMIFLCFILKFDEIFPKNRKLSPKDKLISPIDRKISPIDRKISPIDRKISPIDRIISPIENDFLIIYPAIVCRR